MQSTLFCEIIHQPDSHSTGKTDLHRHPAGITNIGERGFQSLKKNLSLTVPPRRIRPFRRNHKRRRHRHICPRRNFIIKRNKIMRILHPGNLLFPRIHKQITNNQLRQFRRKFYCFPIVIRKILPFALLKKIIFLPLRFIFQVLQTLVCIIDFMRFLFLFTE